MSHNVPGENINEVKNWKDDPWAEEVVENAVEESTEEATPTKRGFNWRTGFPTRALLLLLGIGFVDLVMTAVLHAGGHITELNPLMKPVIETSEWLFALVKGMTLVGAWLVMLKYSDTHLNFIRRACLAGSAAYVVIWTGWFVSSL
ncbi:MAG TPA: DUF5658 family protein [Fimbriimonadaceae bacterium]|nr:DUF5658 family protein [Fimbriimonadaceae bacterium]HRE94240.1 DUF5658 family protein [Fimbriimonadaceae bacterium]